MAVTSSGQITLLDIATEFGGSEPHTLSEYYGKSTVPASGQISIGNFYGTSNAVYVLATGGSISTSGSYKTHTFTGSGTFTITSAGNAAGANTVEYMVLAGGGGGGGSGRHAGGGAGGLLYSSSATLSAGAHSVSIGGGGGNNSSGSNSSLGSITSTGGGYGGTHGGNGGSGGGGGQTRHGYDRGNGIAGQGNDGRNGGHNCYGGGGGKGSGGGSNQPHGGTSYTAFSAAYAGGGGGGRHDAGCGPGSNGGGGAGNGGVLNQSGISASGNSGSGGGGAGWRGSVGGNGGSGIVKVKYQFQAQRRNNMAHFAKIDSEGKVLSIIVIDNSDILIDGVESESEGISRCQSIAGPGTYVQTSYNNTTRLRYAVVGGTYNSTTDSFVNPKPYPSWNFVSDLEIQDWESPVPKTDTDDHWDEDNLVWLSTSGEQIRQ